ncbi:hypothetical protein SLEP1_g57993, partial [Rubroshorea leprosula]
TGADRSAPPDATQSQSNRVENVPLRQPHYRTGQTASASNGKSSDEAPREESKTLTD